MIRCNAYEKTCLFTRKTTQIWQKYINVQNNPCIYTQLPLTCNTMYLLQLEYEFPSKLMSGFREIGSVYNILGHPFSMQSYISLFMHVGNYWPDTAVHMSLTSKGVWRELLLHVLTIWHKDKWQKMYMRNVWVQGFIQFENCIHERSFQNIMWIYVICLTKITRYQVFFASKTPAVPSEYRCHHFWILTWPLPKVF